MAEQDRAFGTIMAGFDFSRALIGLQCLGAAQASLAETWAYVGERKAFGAPLAQYQGVSFPLAEAETQLTMMRQLCYYTLDLRDRGLPHTKEAAMCKWYVPKTSCEIIHQCLILHGHYGYTTDLPHHQRYNDVLGLQIGDGHGADPEARHRPRNGWPHCVAIRQASEGGLEMSDPVNARVEGNVGIIELARPKSSIAFR